MSDFPYVSIDKYKGKPIIELKLPKGFSPRTKRYQANKTGARTLGYWLYQNCQAHYLMSSSVDFPTEHGARNYDFRELINEGVAKADDEEREKLTKELLKQDQAKLVDYCVQILPTESLERILAVFEKKKKE